MRLCKSYQKWEKISYPRTSCQGGMELLDCIIEESNDDGFKDEY